MPDLSSAPSVVITDATAAEALNIIGGAGEPGEIILKGHADRLGINFGIAGGTVIPIDQFTIDVQMASGGDWFQKLAVWGAGEDRFLIDSPTVLNTLAHGAANNGIAILAVGGIWAVRFQAAMAAGVLSDVTRTLQVCRGRSS